MLLESAISLLIFAVAANSQCPNGWSPLYTHTETCVKAFSDQKSFFDAQEYCEAVGAGNRGSLVSIHNAFENAQLGSLAKETSAGCSYWIGLYDFDASGEYHWMDNTTVDYLNWSPEITKIAAKIKSRKIIRSRSKKIKTTMHAGTRKYRKQGEPADPEETAALMNLNFNNRWEAISEIFDRLCFFCEQNAKQMPQTTAVWTTVRIPTTTVDDSKYCRAGLKYYNGHCYYFSADRKNFDDAEATCLNQNGSHLVSILSENEEKFVNGNFPQEPYWIGLRRADLNSDFEWTDGSDPNSYSNWAYYYPIALDSSNCAASNIDYEGKWRNEYCGKSYYYGCKSPAK